MIGRRFKLFSLFGFEVGVDLSWILLAILIAWSLSTGYFPFRYEELPIGSLWAMGIIGAIGLFTSIVVHEFSHSIMARRQGMTVKSITLFMFGGVAESAAEPPGPRSEFLVAAVGPLTSVLLAAVFYGLTAFGMRADWPTEVSGVTGYLAFINTMLAVFNMVPAYPLDGGRVLRSILWHVKGDLRWATRICSQIGSGFGYLLMGLGVFNFLFGNVIGGMWQFLIGMFLKSIASGSYQQLMVRKALEGERVMRFVNTDPVTVPASAPISDVVENFVYKHHHKMYPITDNGDLVGCVSTREIKSVPKAEWPTTPVRNVVRQCSPDNTIGPDVDAVEALSSMRKNNSSRLLVIQGGRLVGIIALKDMLSFLSLKMELE